MKAISLYQPYASLIASGKKTIETRCWATRYRGDLLIASTLKPVVAGLPLGQALCIVEIFDCMPMRPYHEADACCKWYEGAWAWMLRNIRAIEPFAIKGGRGFYEVAIPAPTALAGTLTVLDQIMYSRSAGTFVNRKS